MVLYNREVNMENHMWSGRVLTYFTILDGQGGPLETNDVNLHPIELENVSVLQKEQS